MLTVILVPLDRCPDLVQAEAFSRIMRIRMHHCDAEDQRNSEKIIILIRIVKPQEAFSDHVVRIAHGERPNAEVHQQ